MRNQWQRSLFLAICLVFGIVPGALAEEEPISSVHPQQPITDIPSLNEIEQPLTTAEGLLVQQSAPIPAPAQVTGVQLKPTDQGLEVILETAGTFDEVLTSSAENSLITDIPNAQLRLPRGGAFRRDNPTQDITLVEVTNLDAKTIRVTVMGKAGIPTAEVSQSPQALILSVAAPPSAELRSKPAPAPQPAPAPTAPPVTPAPPEPQQPAVPEAPAPEPQAEEALLDLTVTAEKTPEDVQDVPISITAIPEQEIEDADIDSLGSIANNTPNFSTFSYGSRAFINYSIRGLGNSSLLSRDAVGFYVDDVPYDFGTFLDIDLPDLERVEVLRGPQSTLYGRNAQAGVVNIITRKPTNEFEFNGTASYGNYDDLDVQAGVSGPIVKDQLLFRLSGSYGSRDGYLENTFLDDDVDEQSGGTGRGQLLWSPSEDLEIALNVSFDDYADGAYPIVPRNQSDPFEIEQDFNGFFDRNSNSQSLRIAYDNPDFRFTAITARRFSRSNTLFDADGTTDDIFRVGNGFDSTVFSQELRLQSSENADRFQWLLGGYFESRAFKNNEAQIFGTDAAVIGSSPGTISTNGEVDETILAAFGQASYQPIEALTLTAGLRYESAKSTLESYENLFTLPDGTPLSPPLSASDVEQDSDAWLPRFAIEYRFNPSIMAYSSIARGYKPAGVNFRADNLDTLTFDAERSWNYEVGLKSSWLDDRLTINLALFHNPVNDFQVLVSDLVGIQEIANADVSLTGAELEVKAAPIEGLDLIAGFGYVDTKFTDFTNPSGESFNGNRLTFAPDFTYNLAVQYRNPIGIFGRVELVGLGTTYFDEANTVKQDPYAIVNVRIGYEVENYGIYFFANNLFDTEYVTYAFDFLESVGTFGAPTTYGIQLRTRF